MKCIFVNLIVVVYGYMYMHTCIWPLRPCGVHVGLAGEELRLLGEVMILARETYHSLVCLWPSGVLKAEEKPHA